MINCGLTKTFALFGFLFELVFSLCFQVLLKVNIASPSILPFIDPKLLPNDHTMCIVQYRIFLQKVFGQKVFSKFSFPKTPELRFALKVLDLGYEKYFKEYI